MDSKIPGNLLTTAMAVMPHTDVSRALEMALSLDVHGERVVRRRGLFEDGPDGLRIFRRGNALLTWGSPPPVYLLEQTRGIYAVASCAFL